MITWFNITTKYHSIFLKALEFKAYNKLFFCRRASPQNITVFF